MGFYVGAMMSIAIAMILLSKGARLSRSKTLADFKAIWSLEIDPSSVGKEKGVLTINFDEAFAAVAMMPAPIPSEELEGPIQTSVLWPEAGNDIALSRGHLVVTMAASKEGSAVEIRKLLTKVVASILAGCEGAQGVYWCEAGILIRSDVFRAIAIESLPDPPLPLWIDFRVGVEDGKAAGFTHGLEALGLMEIECEAANESPVEFRDRLVGIAGYLIANGLVIQNGHTVGEDEHERIRVVYSKSSFGHENAVMRLEYESAKKKKKPFWKRG